MRKKLILLILLMIAVVYLVAYKVDKAVLERLKRY